MRELAPDIAIEAFHPPLPEMAMLMVFLQTIGLASCH
jgi:hypothetical protein